MLLMKENKCFDGVHFLRLVIDLSYLGFLGDHPACRLFTESLLCARHWGHNPCSRRDYI